MYAVLGRRRARIVREELREGSGHFSVHAFLPMQARARASRHGRALPCPGLQPAAFGAPASFARLHRASSHGTRGWWKGP